MLLAIVIDFVIRHIETNAHAATNALGQLRLAYQRLGRLHGRLEAAKEEERRFLAHELHDELGQTLTAIKLRVQLGARASSLAAAPASAPDTAEALGLLDRLIAQVRKMSGDLRPPLLDEVGLFPALRAYVENQTTLSGVPIELEARDPDAGRLAPDLEIACFRVVQESIANALRHAATPRVRVRVMRGASGISLSIADEGRGFDTATLDTATASGHLGVVGMRERVRARGGRFRIDSRPGAGTTVAVELPMASS
jgi:signal transduction histidine kinase